MSNIEHSKQVHIKGLTEIIDWINEQIEALPEGVFRCTCEDDEERRGFMDYDVNVYEHLDDCPSHTPYHFLAILTDVKKVVARYEPEKTR